MKGRLLRGSAAALMAIVLSVTAAATPAHAIPIPITEIGKYIDIINKAVSLVRNITGGGVSDADLRQAVQEIIAKVEDTKVEILGHMDALAAAEVRACARHHVIEFIDIDLMDPVVRQIWAQDATECAILAESFLRTVTDKSAADSLGLALNVVGPIALAARARAGFTTFALMDTLHAGNNVVMTKVAPTCRLWRDTAFGLVFEHFDCVSHNGDTAGAKRWWNGEWHGTIDQAAVKSEASRRTSRAIAEAVLPTL